MSMGQYDKALQQYKNALKILILFYGQSHPDIATLYGNIGRVYNSMSKYDKAF